MFGLIVVGTDGWETAEHAVRQAIELARLSGAKLDIVSAYEPISAERLRGEKAEIPGDVQYTVNPREDVNLILDVAEETKADLIVVGNKGMTGAKRFLLGSVPNKVSHHAPTGVLIVRTT